MKVHTIITLLLLCVCHPGSYAQERLLGGDISLLPSYVSKGTAYRDGNGKKVKPLTFFKKQGWNAMRVRLFVDPENAPQENKDEGVCQNLTYTTQLGREIKRAGYKLMLDFQYSDTWADPAKQFTPKQWETTKKEALPDSVYEYTKRCLTTMVKAGVQPDLIQIGNEISFGMLWPTAKINPTKADNWDIFSALLRGGAKACREVCPQARIIIHTEKAGEWNFTKAFYKNIERYGVDYDIIGLSYYPMWHKSIGVLSNTLDSISTTFGNKEVMIVETAAYYSHDHDKWATPDQYSEFFPINTEGQRLFTMQLVKELKRHKNVTGLFWWFPEENACGNDLMKCWINRGLFDNHNGRVLPAMDELKKFME